MVAIEAEVIPLPSELNTPPVTNMKFSLNHYRELRKKLIENCKIISRL